MGDNLAELLQRERARQIKAQEYYDEYYFYYFSDKDIINTPLSKQSHIKISTERSIYPIDFVCRRESGEYTSSRIMQFAPREIHKKILEGFDYHSLRHTHTTDLAERGFHDKYTQERLGHKSIRTFKNTYEHLSDNMRESESQRLNQFYRGGLIEDIIQKS